VVDEETIAYLIQYYKDSPATRSLMSNIIRAIRKFFNKNFGMFMTEQSAVDYLSDMVAMEANNANNNPGRIAFNKKAKASGDAVMASQLGDAAGDFIDDFKSGTKAQSWGLLNVRQIAEVLGRHTPDLIRKYIPQFKLFEADMNRMKQDAGDIASERQKLKKPENEKLSVVQHKATIARYDPSSKQPVEPGDFAIKAAYDRLSDGAKKVYGKRA